ncbi:hypothetical protein BDV59DRAFT_4057 [Aspergillus ambiguus]|uniref:uncharacterized protein n=1 Tax=Aspergillus ambiguus TaxID=176160 RepID=UPI003CCD0651
MQRAPPKLPSPVQFIENILSQLASCTDTPLSQTKPWMLTLHCLFPNELLLALDILDRRLVKRLRRDSSPGADELFFVISASAPPSLALSTAPATKGYEVRLHAWNCTCPTFALAAFRDPPPGDDPDPEPAPVAVSVAPAYRFGGSLTRGSTAVPPPVCKHLLACLLAVRCPGVVGGADSDDPCAVVKVSPEEMAGLCAGWGG